MSVNTNTQPSSILENEWNLDAIIGSIQEEREAKTDFVLRQWAHFKEYPDCPLQVPSIEMDGRDDFKLTIVSLDSDDFVLWKSCISSGLYKLFSRNVFPVSMHVGENNILVVMTTEDAIDLLGFLKPLLGRTNIEKLKCCSVPSEVVNQCSEIFERNSIHTVTLEKQLNENVDFKSWLIFFRKVQPSQVHYQSVSLEDDFANFLVPLAETTRAIKVDGTEAFSPFTIPVVKKMLSAKCCYLYIRDSTTCVSADDVEQLLKFFHHTQKKVCMKIEANVITMSVNIEPPPSSNSENDMKFDALIEALRDQQKAKTDKLIERLMHFNANRERRLQAYSFEMCRYFRERPKFRFAIICYDSEDFVLWKTGVTSALFKLNIDLSKLKIAQQKIEVVMCAEKSKDFLEFLKPLIERANIDEIGLYGLPSEIINCCSEIFEGNSFSVVKLTSHVPINEDVNENYKSWLIFFRKVQAKLIDYMRTGMKNDLANFLVPLAEIAPVIRIEGAYQIVFPPITVPILKKMLSGKCCHLFINDDITSLSTHDAEQLLKFFHHTQKKFCVKIAENVTPVSRMNAQIGEYAISPSGQPNGTLFEHVDIKQTFDDVFFY